MRRRGLVLGIALLIVGALVLGGGITGEVISQSCCFPPDCPASYTCDAAEPLLESPGAISASAVLGSFLLGLGALFIALDTAASRRERKS